jgi:S-(hydroxymethyl)glutathione dehydrogenase/alcohol dehydrogenase
MKARAAILIETGKPLEVVELGVPPLAAGQVLVEIAFSGVCHTQLLEVRGHRGHDPYLPHCLGHEGSGIVVDIGDGVTRVDIGDQVVLSWIKGDGCDVPGTVYAWDGRAVNAGGITTFQDYAVISENRLTKLPPGIGLREAAMLGCALPTGLGSVFNTAAARPGQSLAVFGCGGVGLCAVAGAEIAGCWPIIAVDLLPGKLELAQQLGATHTLRADEADPVAAIRDLCPGGVDIAIEATGQPAVMQQALEAVRMQGGSAVVIGNAPHGRTLTLDPKLLNQGKRLLGTWGGDCRPTHDLPRFARLISSGRLDIAPLIGDSYPLHAVNAALDDLEAGRVARPMMVMDE